MKQSVVAGIIAAKLVRNGLRYRYLRLTGRPGKPQAVSLEVTHRCVCRCVMCNIWTIPQSEPDPPLQTLEETVGNVSATPIAELYGSRDARRLRSRIGRSPECAAYTEPGLERYSLPFEGLAYLRTLFRLRPRSFLELHAHLGLDKYV